MNFRFALITAALSWCSMVLNGIENDEQILYGVCYQFNTPNPMSPQIILSTKHQQIDFKDYEFQTSSNDPINCIWFPSNENAEHGALTMNEQTVKENFKNNGNVQQSISGQSLIRCNNQTINISHSDNSDIESNHLCSNFCHQQSCSNFLASRNIPSSYQGTSNVSKMIPSMFGISGICVAFIVLCAAIYCFTIKYAQWNEDKSGNETEQVIGDVLEEIAKYTIGDDEDGFYGDWMDNDSESTDSHSVEEALGVSIISHHQLPDIDEIPNPSIDSSSLSSSESEEESDEEQLREDLLVAKETLYATSYGINNPYSSTINNQKIVRKINMNKQGTPKKSPLLSGGESSDYKISSDGCNNSDLP